jgi:hypothetical protein
LEGLYEEGSLFFDRRSREPLIRAWPDLIIRSCLASLYPHFQGNALFFMKDGKRDTFAIQEPFEHLTRFVHHAIECHTSPYGVVPEWVEGLLASDTFELTHLDPYISFFLQRTAAESIAELAPLWKSRAKELFYPLYEEAHV